MKRAMFPGAAVAVCLAGWLLSDCGDGITQPIQIVVDAAGGTFTFANGNVIISFPANAVSQPETITVQATTQFPPSPTVVPGTVFDVTPNGLTFNVPVQVTIKFTPASLPVRVLESELRLFKVVAGQWQRLVSSSYNASAKTITASITSLSVYGILGVPVATVTVTPPTPSVTVGAVVSLTATLRDSSNTVLPNRPVTWSTSDAGVATVSTSGVVRGMGAGQATITAMSEGQSGTATVTVTASTGDPVPDGNDRVLFDMRAGGAFALSQYSTKQDMLNAGLWDGGQNGSWTVVTDYDGAGQHAIRMDWAAWGGVCADQEVILIRSVPSPKPTESYFQFKVWLGRTATGGGNGNIGAYQLTNPNCGTGGNAGAKRFMWLRDGVGGGSTGRFEHLWPGPAPSNADITSDDLVLHYDFSPLWNAQDHVGEVITVTLYFRAETTPGANDGIVRAWVNGVQHLNRTNVPAMTNAVDRFQFPTVFNSPLQAQSEYWFDIVAWEPVP